MPYRAALSMLAVLLAAAPAAAGPFEDANAAYERGDYAAALKLWRPLAEQGNAGAQLFLGLMHDLGRGVPEDRAEAAVWYRRAADRGNAVAQYNLAVMYRNGDGVQRDPAKAAQWYRKAAEQGDADAMHSLAQMHADGEGVPQDEAEALKWLDAAIARVPQIDADKRAQMLRQRTDLAARMPPEALADAERRGRQAKLPAAPARAAAVPAAPAAAAEDDGKAQIAEAQRLLARLGYQPGPADGIAGRGTLAAVRAYQGKAGLPVDGRIDQALLARLRADAR